MNKKQMIDAAPHVGAQDLACVDVLRVDNEDLRASAILWKTLYEEAQRRCVELENALKGRAPTRVDVRFPLGFSIGARSRRSGARIPPL